MDGCRDCPAEGSQVRQRRRNMVMTSLRNLKKNDTNELIYKTERDSQTWRRSLRPPGAKDGRKQ